MGLKSPGWAGHFCGCRSKALYAWYEEHLGISSPNGSFTFPHETNSRSIAVAFPKDFGVLSGFAARDVNFQVHDLDGVLTS